MAGLGNRELGAYDVLVVTSLLWFLAQFVRYLFPPLFGTFQALYGVSNTTLGLLFTALMLAYAGMQFPSGALSDRVGTPRVIVAGGLVAATGAALAFAVQSLAALGLAAVLIGLGTGAHKTVAITLLSRVYPRRIGRLLGTMDAIGHLGGAAGPAAVALVLAAGVGWPTAFLAVAVAGVGLTGAFRSRLARRAVPGEPGEVTGARDGARVPGGTLAYLRPFADPQLSTILLVTVAHAVVWNGVAAFLPLYLSSRAGLSAGAAGLVFASMFVMALVQPVTGALADRVGRHPMMVSTLGLAGAGLVALVLAPDPLLAVVAVPLVGLGGHGFRPVRDAYLVETIPPRVGGGTLGMARTVMLGAGATAPAAVGYLSDVTGYRVAFGALAAGLAVGIALVVGSLVIGRGR